MRRQPNYRIRKRDGREEWLRSTKLVRSISKALLADEALQDVEASSGVSMPGTPDARDLFTVRRDDWRAYDLATAVLTGLSRTQRPSRGDETAVWTTDGLAAAVEQVLTATGFQGAAAAYARTRDDRRRRQGAMQLALASAGAQRKAAERGLERPADHRTG